MAKWDVTFQCGKGEDEKHYGVQVECHWGYNAPKVAMKELEEHLQQEVHANLVAIEVKLA